MFTAIIPARGGSTRLKNKHTIPFGESNLIVHKIRQIKQVPSVDQIVVSSDSDVILDLAKQEGVLTHKRSWEYCDEKTKNFGEVVRHICENVEGDDILWALSTLPLITPKHYTEMIEAYKNRPAEYDSVLVAEPFKRYLFDEHGPVNFKLGTAHVRSQELPKLHTVYGASVASRKDMIEWYHHIGQHSLLYEIPKISAIDIDDELDMEVAKAWYARLGDFLQ